MREWWNARHAGFRSQWPKGRGGWSPSSRTILFLGTSIMGEMADFALEEVEDFENARLGYRMGDVDATEAFERGIIDDLGREAIPSTGAPVICKYCGNRDLKWVENAKQSTWRMCCKQTGKPHVCEEYRDQKMKRIIA